MIYIYIYIHIKLSSGLVLFHKRDGLAYSDQSTEFYSRVGRGCTGACTEMRSIFPQQISSTPAQSLGCVLFPFKIAYALHRLESRNLRTIVNNRLSLDCKTSPCVLIAFGLK